MKSLNRLITSLKRLPGIGPKQAERLALYLLRAPDYESENFIAALKEAKTSVKFCRECWDFSESPVCRRCADESRDKSLICVVEEPQDVLAVDKSGYRGLYHVLHGALSPLDGVGPERLRIRELLERLKGRADTATEVILATDPDAEGETTALYIATQLKSSPRIKVSRIGHGVPMGGDLDYLDEGTLSHALAGRREMDSGGAR
ncbi:MAG: recombination mediator RecR [Elusimicrobia bacterium]|nr:recombination mediator RecR [Elusimicrobiota bacterium]MDE2313076.1 recombination mediator RecR [Elusimicrobiota bacterium]